MLGSFMLQQGIAQTATLQTDIYTDYLRNRQLAADSSPVMESFCVRPLQLQNSIENLAATHKSSYYFSLMPVTLITRDNAHHPTGSNEGALIPAKGPQAFFSAGFFAKIGMFTLQVQPEIVYAQNQQFETFALDNSPFYWNVYYKLLNNIDNPEQFGTGTYKKFLPGQSSFYFHPKNLAIGVSTENIWWGPGIQNSLVMSNNAPGFAHADIHTTAPLKTPLGHFEFQLLGGQLQNSNIAPPDTNFVYNSNFLYQRKDSSNRYITGIVVSWQPKWIKGLFLGFSQASYLYQKDISGIADILPLQGLVTSTAESKQKKATLGSVFLRYVLPEDHAEFYAEYGRNDRSADIINLITDKNYPRGYVVGMRKLANLRASKSRMEFTAELAELELPTIALIDSNKSWYTNNYVRQGYTNEGKVIGAGIGPGSNSQMMDISWLKGFTKIGVQFQRVVHNNDLYYNLFTYSKDWTRHWIDISTNIHARIKYKQLYLQAQLEITRSLNYEYYVLPGSAYLEHGYDFLNIHGGISCTYRF